MKAFFSSLFPVAVAMGGGYGRDVEVVARLHARTIAEGRRAYETTGARRATA